MKSRHYALRVAAPLLALGLAACGGKDDAAKPATQVAAKVNSNEISVHQINNALSRYSGLQESQAKQASQQILEKLIDQELLVQKAMENKLDRDPKVMQAIESSRRQLLAQAYVERTMAAASKPTEEQIKAFYAERPELFEQRRIYRLQELAVDARGEQLSRLQAQVAKSKSMNDVVSWLKAQDMKFTANAAVKAAEQLPLEVLSKLHAARDGQILTLPGRNAVVVVQVAAAQPMPLNQKEATPYIEQFLQNQERLKLAEKEVKGLRESAKLEYMGEFSKLAAAKTTVAPATIAPAATARDSSDYVEKGISGLR